MPAKGWVSYATVKDAVPIERVLERIGHPFTRKADGRIEAICPDPQGNALAAVQDHGQREPQTRGRLARPISVCAPARWRSITLKTPMAQCLRGLFT